MADCRVCGNVEGNAPFIAREAMFGRGGEFPYFECGACGCVQIEEVPRDLSAYYPADYYSFGALAEEGALKQFFLRRRSRHLAGRESLVGWLYERLSPAPPLPAWLRDAGVRTDAEVLEVGCGSGAQLVQLAYSGFDRLTGIDPFNERDVRYRCGVVVLKRTLEEFDGAFDFIMLHHSFEHMPEQAGALRHLRRLLKGGGRVLLRVPVAGGLAWREYGRDWAQLDAPRHLFINTERSLRLLAAGAGFEVERVVYDSNGFQFWGSEQIRRGVPLVSPSTGRMAPAEGLFTEAELAAFEEEAARLNREGDGDQACFYLRVKG